MAISRFQQNRTTNLSTFFQWLNDNKAGTFLENFTMTNTRQNNTNDTVEITDGNATVMISSIYNATYKPVRYTSTVLSKEIGSAGTAYMVKAILCKKGLIVQYNGHSSSLGTDGDWCAIAITVDNNGGISCILNDATVIPNADGLEINNFDTYSPNALNVTHTLCRAYYGANLTCIVPVTFQSTDPLAMLPYAYVATRTQLLSEGLQAVMIDGDTYITNGAWYIKDGD